MTEHRPGFVVAVVDDDHGILQSLEYLLESAYYTVRRFTSAIDLLASGSLREVDCVISDVDMPGMDGFELLQLIEVARPGMPTILITGYPDRLERMPLIGPNRPRVFTKPFKGQELLAAVGESLNSRNRG